MNKINRRIRRRRFGTRRFRRRFKSKYRMGFRHTPAPVQHQALPMKKKLKCQTETITESIEKTIGTAVAGVTSYGHSDYQIANSMYKNYTV